MAQAVAMKTRNGSAKFRPTWSLFDLASRSIFDSSATRSPTPADVSISIRALEARADYHRRCGRVRCCDGSGVLAAVVIRCSDA